MSLQDHLSAAITTFAVLNIDRVGHLLVIASMPRQDSDQSIPKITKSGRTWSLRKQASSPPKPKVQTVKQSISVYDLDWEDVKRVLVMIFPTLQHDDLIEDVSLANPLSL